MNDREVLIGCYRGKLQKDCRLRVPKTFRSIFGHALQAPKHRLILKRGEFGGVGLVCRRNPILGRDQPCDCVSPMVCDCGWQMGYEILGRAEPCECVWPVSFDRQGRLRIPAAALELIPAKPGEDVILTGLFDSVEILSERVWKEEHAAPNPTHVA